MVLQAGERVGVAEVGILATVGATRVEVYRTPHVGVLSTGACIKAGSRLRFRVFYEVEAGSRGGVGVFEVESVWGM